MGTARIKLKQRERIRRQAERREYGKNLSRHEVKSERLAISQTYCNIAAISQGHCSPKE